MLRQRARCRGAVFFVMIATLTAFAMLASVANATQGDLYAAGITYRAGTYPDHGAITWFGHMPDEWVVDINADAGDMGRPILAPEDGSVIVNSTGSGGSALVITWISANGSEKICIGHLKDIVKTGAVLSGDVIGHAGASGLSDATADHMHVVRQLNGVPAPLVLSGHTIVPAMSPWPASNGNPYTSAGPINSLAKYARHIVQQKGDKKKQKTSWYVSADLRRLWIPDIATFNALRSTGAPKPDVLTSGELNALPDQKNFWAAAGNAMTKQRTLRREMAVRSANGKYAFTLRSDGNLALTGPGNAAIWEAKVSSIDYLVFQRDGNLVGYKDGVAAAVWATNTGKSARRLVVRNDGVAAILNANGKWLWSTNAPAQRVGEPYGGGVIAYILQPGDPGYVAGQTHGLIAATADQTSEDYQVQWATEPYWGISVPGVLGTAIGTGMANTNAIIAQNGAGTTYAAGLARAYTGGDYNDWFLPSMVELHELYLNRVAIGGFDTTYRGWPYYWSSSQFEDGHGGAKYQCFVDDDQGDGASDSELRVRAVRAF